MRRCCKWSATSLTCHRKNKVAYAAVPVASARLAAAGRRRAEPSRQASQTGRGERDDRIAGQSPNCLPRTTNPRSASCRRCSTAQCRSSAARQVLIVKDGKGRRRRQRAAGAPLPEEREDVVVNNRLRRELASAIAALKLASQNRDTRMAAAKALQNGADEEMLPLISKVCRAESDPEIKKPADPAAGRLAAAEQGCGDAACSGESARLQQQPQYQNAAARPAGKERRGLCRARCGSPRRGPEFTQGGRIAAVHGRSLRPDFHRRQPRFHPAARRARAWRSPTA